MSTFISFREAAKRLGVHENTVRRYADRGLIGAVLLLSGVRRLRRSDVEAMQPGSPDDASPTVRAIDSPSQSSTISSHARALGPSAIWQHWRAPISGTAPRTSTGSSR